MAQRVPAVDYLVLDVEPHLQARECTQCTALYFDRRNACARCSADEFAVRALSNKGVIRAYTIVQRGAKSGPFTSVVVELDGGGSVKANLIGVTDPADIAPETRVRLVTFDTGTDDDGTVAVAFGYQPIGAEQ
ncbi:OB-fold domain-containing protein [Mycolicibacterium neoaurum]|uniref:OB-fold domain-containing protein n=1 Tax=Mycolicibacterium neoaurum TaxID=1795 RepID=UPI0026711BFE|nr:OB-fold domain-containing protein [Mycolicibacterium neoaurum]MDO3402744.1 OB-fold domain-containing protein [Mycolicibacterium neoaurum]